MPVTMPRSRSDVPCPTLPIPTSSMPSMLPSGVRTSGRAGPVRVSAEYAPARGVTTNGETRSPDMDSTEDPFTECHRERPGTERYRCEPETVDDTRQCSGHWLDECEGRTQGWWPVSHWQTHQESI